MDGCCERDSEASGCIACQDVFACPRICQPLNDASAVHEYRSFSKEFLCFFYEQQQQRAQHVSLCVFTLALFREGNRMEVGEAHCRLSVAFDEINKSCHALFQRSYSKLRALAAPCLLQTSLA